MNNLTVAV
jgi:hypothetical protein